MVRFHCDRCNGEVEGPDEMVEIVIEGRERPNLAAWTWRAEMCRPCYESTKDAITNLVENAEDPKRKTVRRAGS
jgi:hypothetical protein